MPFLVNADKWPHWYVLLVLIAFGLLTAYMAWVERH
jgi:CHASE2 domain-containing sensor protein